MPCMMSQDGNLSKKQPSRSSIFLNKLFLYSKLQELGVLQEMHKINCKLNVRLEEKVGRRIKIIIA